MGREGNRIPVPFSGLPIGGEPWGPDVPSDPALSSLLMGLDALIFGGGIAGLWTLDELRRAGFAAALLEAGALGAGQTVCSQGIIHGGVKYTLSGLLHPAAEAIREMPGLWRSCLRGEVEPNLSRARVRAESCHMWRTDSLRSRAGMLGAKVGLRVAPVTVEDDERPAALRACPGTVARLDEQVIDPASVLAVLAERNRGLVGRALPERVSIARAGPGWRVSVGRESGGAVEIEAKTLVFAAGRGNEALRRAVGLDAAAMQVRPLHMAMARGSTLPELNGHCADGARTRITITTDADSHGRRVWQIGGQLAEDGVKLSETELVAHAKREVGACLPGVDLRDVEWSTYRADRAELAQRSGVRPDDATMLVENGVITLWPTKLALAPRGAAMVSEALTRLGAPSGPAPGVPGLEAPPVELPPWEGAREWLS